MQPNRIGRALGIGARVAGAKLREQADRLAAAPPQNAPRPANASAVAEPPQSVPPRPQPSRPAVSPRAAVSRPGAAAQGGYRPAASPGIAEAAGNSRRLARGAGRFGFALLRPFAHATSVLWHQIAGLFFALFSIFFFEHAWFVWKAHHFADRHILLYAALGLLFAWFTVSSFWRARRRQRQMR